VTRWRACPCNKRYSISDGGLVRNQKTRKHVKRYDNGRGYLRVRLYHAKKGRGHWYAVHLLVLRTWGTERPGDDYEGAHDDGNRLNNSFNNLFWKTKEENTADRAKHFAQRKAKLETSHS
jgi:hypothetical protein